MDIFFGVIGGVLNAIRLIPQVYHSHKYRTTKSLSWFFLGIVFFQSIFLIFYGFYKPDQLIVQMNVPPLFCAIWLIILKRKYK